MIRVCGVLCGFMHSIRWSGFIFLFQLLVIIFHKKAECYCRHARKSICSIGCSLETFLIFSVEDISDQYRHLSVNLVNLVPNRSDCGPFPARLCSRPVVGRFAGMLVQIFFSQFILIINSYCYGYIAYAFFNILVKFPVMFPAYSCVNQIVSSEIFSASYLVRRRFNDYRKILMSGRCFIV